MPWIRRAKGFTMMSWLDVGRFLIIAGTVVVAVGVVLVFADKIPFGRFPGDIRLGAGRFQLHVPVVTCVLLSILITFLVNLFSRR